MCEPCQPPFSCVSPHCIIFSYPVPCLLCPSTSAVLMEQEDEGDGEEKLTKLPPVAEKAKGGRGHYSLEEKVKLLGGSPVEGTEKPAKLPPVADESGFSWRERAVSWSMLRRASELQCLKVARNAGQFSRLLDLGVYIPGVYIQLMGVITRFRLKLQCFGAQMSLLYTHVLSCYLFPLRAACCCHSHVGIEDS